MTDWAVTAVKDLAGRVYRAVEPDPEPATDSDAGTAQDMYAAAADRWLGPDGKVYIDRDELERRVGTTQPCEVSDLPSLIYENNLLYEACVAHELRQTADADLIAGLEGRVRGLRAAVMAARRALAGTPTACVQHGTAFVPDAPCCVGPRDTSRALRVIDAADPIEAADAPAGSIARAGGQ